MKRILILFAALLSLLLMAPSGCGPQPTPNPPPNPPTAQGGTVGSGGSVGLGGTPAEGGSSAVAGAAGSTVAAVVFPPCNDVTAKAKPVVRHPLGPKRHAIKGRARASYQIVGGLRNVFHGSNVDCSTDQGPIGSCTGEAPVQIWATSPFLGTGTFASLNQLAYDVYSGATKRDNIRGDWPPNDTGSFGIYSMQEMVARGLFSGFKSARSFAELQELGQTRGCIVGTNWTDTMFAPDRVDQREPWVNH